MLEVAKLLIKYQGLKVASVVETVWIAWVWPRTFQVYVKPFSYISLNPSVTLVFGLFQ